VAGRGPGVDDKNKEIRIATITTQSNPIGGKYVQFNDGLQAYFLLSLRDDSLAALDRFKTRIPNLFANALRLDYLDRSAAREAIVGPLDEFNRLTVDFLRNVSGKGAS